jgi:thioredoxin-related protein
MKRVLLITFFMLLAMPMALVNASPRKVAPPKPDDAEIHWLTIDELQVKMKEKPKKVYIDFYTGWCGWCKRMDATTMKNPQLVKYMNDNYYCVRFDAERKDTVWFMGKAYGFDEKNNANAFAVEYLKGKMSYPTIVIMLEFYQNPQPIPGYREVPFMEMLLKYFGDNIFKKQSWDDYTKEFKGNWS